MEKMTWIRPMATVEQFMANEYIAACGDKTPAVYKFTCNAGGGVYGGAWRESNRVDGLQSNGSFTGGYRADQQITWSTGSFHACNDTHEVPIEDIDQFIPNCYYKPYGAHDSEAISVLVWRGENNDDVHCCTGLTDIGSLPIIKS